MFRKSLDQCSCCRHNSTSVIAQELREYGICVNGYAPGTIQTDLGMCAFGSSFRLTVVLVYLTPFVAVEAEKVAGDKTVQEVCRCSSHQILCGWLMRCDR